MDKNKVDEYLDLMANKIINTEERVKVIKLLSEVYECGYDGAVYIDECLAKLKRDG